MVDSGLAAVTEWLAHGSDGNHYRVKGLARTDARRAAGDHATRAVRRPPLPDSVNSDPSFSPLADSFCRAARGRCKCRTSGAGGVLRGEHHFLSNLFGTYQAIITIHFELAGPPSASKIFASEVNILLKVVFCRLRLADRACSRCSALPLRKACSDQWDPLVHTSRPHLPYV